LHRLTAAAAALRQLGQQSRQGPDQLEPKRPRNPQRQLLFRRAPEFDCQRHADHPLGLSGPGEPAVDIEIGRTAPCQIETAPASMPGPFVFKPYSFTAAASSICSSADHLPIHSLARRRPASATVRPLALSRAWPSSCSATRKAMAFNWPPPPAFAPAPS